MQAAGLVPELSDPRLVATVFAPDDNALGNLLKATGLTAAQLLSDTSALTQVCTSKMCSNIGNFTCFFHVTSISLVSH